MASDVLELVPEGFRDLAEPILRDCAETLDRLSERLERHRDDPDRIRERDIRGTDPNEPVAVFGSACVICGGDCSSVRLTSRLGICERCLPYETDRLLDALETAREEHGPVGEVLLAFKLLLNRVERGELDRERVESFFRERVWPELFTEIANRAFEEATGFRLYSAQAVWTRRLVRGCSFSILAPTGTGKTSWASLMSALLAHAGRRVYYLVPTTTLVRQVEERIRDLAERADLDVEVVGYHAALPRERRAEAQRRIREGDFDVLITTAQFLVHRVDELERLDFDVIFVDDVDAIIRGTGRNVDRLLRVAGLRQEEIDAAYRLANLRRRYYSLRDWLESLEERGEERRAERVRRDLKRIEREMEELESQVERARDRDLARVVFMSATGAAAPSRRLAIVRELFDFEVGAGGEGPRNIQDVAVPRRPSPEAVRELAERVGPQGGLIFVPQRLPGGARAREVAEELAEYLRDHGIEARAVHAGTPAEEREEAIDAFAEGEVDVLVAVASPYGVIVRGLDLPQAARYAIFYGIPRQRIRLTPREEDLKDVTYVASALSNLARLVDDTRLRSRLEGVAGRLWRIVRRGAWYRERVEEAVEDLSIEELRRLADRDADELADELDVEPWLARNVRTLAEGVRELLDLLGDRERVERLAREATTVAVREEDGESFLEVPDLRTYVQASGRVSRLFAGGVTFGLSFVLCDPEDDRELRLLNGLIRRMSYAYGTEFEWRSYPEELTAEDIGLRLKGLSEERLSELVERVDRDRERVRRILRGELEPEEAGRLARSALMIVESPNKARMIASLFSRRPSRRRLEGGVAYETTAEGLHLTVVATQGHVADLVEDAGVFGVERVGDRWVPVYDVLGRCRECGEQVVGREECPNCGGEVELKTALLESIRDLAAEADVILIGTDPDTEGEKIGWDVFNYLGWVTAEVHRTEFHEVTRRGITEALREENWKEVDAGRVSAQILRRVADRWIGFALSQDLWDVFKRLTIDLGEHDRGTLIELRLRLPEGVRIVSFRRRFEDGRTPARPVRVRREGDEYVVRTRITRGGPVTYVATLMDEDRKLGDAESVREEAVKVKALANGEEIEPDVRLEAMTWLSAGRVQTPVLGWVIDRAREYRETEFYAGRARVPAGKEEITALIEELRLPEDLAERVREAATALRRIAEEGEGATLSRDELGPLADTDLFEPADGAYRLSERARELLRERGLVGLLLAALREVGG